jgi:hypothetical protein
MNAMHVTSKEAPQSSSASALEAMDLDMDTEPAGAPLSGSKAGKSLPPETPLVLSHVTAQHTSCSLSMVPSASGSENVESSQQVWPPAVVLPLDESPDALADAGTKTVTMEQMRRPVSVTGATEEANGSIMPAALENGCDDPLPNIEPQASPAAVHAAPTSLEIAPTSFENSESFEQTSPCLAETIDPSAHSSTIMPAIVKSNKTSLPLSPSEATEADMESATLQQSPLKSEEKLLQQPEQDPSSPSVKNTDCSPEAAPPGFENLDSSEQLPPPPPLSMKLGQYFSILLWTYIFVVLAWYFCSHVSGSWLIRTYLKEGYFCSVLPSYCSIDISICTCTYTFWFNNNALDKGYQFT